MLISTEKKPSSILRVLVGSRAHGMERPDSDWDYRGVFVNPTTDFFKLGKKAKLTNWNEGATKQDDDDTTWEIGHFMHMAFQCNPTILEVFGAPRVVGDTNGYGRQLRELLPHVVSPERVRDSFIGYSRNQWKKLHVDNQDTRTVKYALAASMTMFQGFELLHTGKMVVEFPESWKRELRNLKEKIEAGTMSNGEILDHIEHGKAKLNIAADQNRAQFEPNQDKVNEFLIKVRKDFW